MKVRGLRWWILALIVLVTIINYLDRNTLGIMWQEIVKDLHLVDAEPGSEEFQALSKKLFTTVNMIFMVAYGLSQFFSGRIYDKIGTRKGFTISVLIWAVFDALTAFASGIKQIFGLRTVFGLGVAGPWPGAVKNNAEWFPQRQRALAQGLFNAGASIGAILAPILIGVLFAAFGWKVTFIVIGSLGLLWIVPWLVVNKKGPKEHPWITEEEKQLITEGQPAVSGKIAKTRSYRELFSCRKSWAVILGRFFLDPIWWMFVSFLPIYLYEVHGMDVKSLAMTAWVPYVGAAVGSFAGGWFSGMLIRRGHSINFSRKAAIVLGAVIVFPMLVLVAFVKNPIVAVICMAVILFGFQFTMNNIQTIPSDLFAGKSVGSLAGLGGAAAAVGTICSMLFIPVLTAGGNWSPFFIMGALLVPLCVACIFFFGGKIESQE